MGEAKGQGNAPLIRAMKMAARGRTDENRKKLYHTLISSELLLAVTGATNEDEPLGDEGFVQGDPLEGRPTALVFTSRANAKRWSDTHEHYFSLNGTDLFLALIETSVGAVTLNVAGPVGGELYRHELETIAEGGRVLRLRRQAAAESPAASPVASQASTNPEVAMSRKQALGWLRRRELGRGRFLAIYGLFFLGGPVCAFKLWRLSQGEGTFFADVVLWTAVAVVGGGIFGHWLWQFNEAAFLATPAEVYQDEPGASS